MELKEAVTLRPELPPQGRPSAEPETDLAVCVLRRRFGGARTSRPQSWPKADRAASGRSRERARHPLSQGQFASPKKVQSSNHRGKRGLAILLSSLENRLPA